MNYSSIKLNAIFIFVLINLLGLFFLTRDFIYFRDYAIIFDGASRIVQGGKPYTDFGLPVGPITFLLTAFFLNVLSGEWISLFVTQYFINIIMLMSVFGLYKKLKIESWVIYLSTIFFCIFYLVFQTHPWYNTTAVMFLFLTHYFILCEFKYSIFIAGIFSALSLLSKQDIGVLLIFVSLFQIFYLFKNNYLRNILLFIGGILAILILFFYYFGFENILYWLNIGQHGGGRNPFNNQPTFLTLVSIVSIIFGIIKHNNIYLVCGVIIGVASISTNTSGLYFTHFYYVAGLAPIILCSLNKNFFKSFLFIILFVFLIRPILASDFYMIVNFLKNHPEHFLFNSNLISSEETYADMGLCDKRLKNILAPVDTCNLIFDLKNLIASREIPQQGNILNLSELRVLNYIIDYKVPLGHPLWYDTGIALYPREQELINFQIKSGVFDIILAQLDGVNNPKWIDDFLATDLGKSYILKKYNSPSDMTDCKFQINCTRNFLLLYRKNDSRSYK